MLAFRDEIFSVKARDHRGRDVNKILAKWDRDTVNDFAQRSWLGYAEEHWVELDFGDRLSKFGPNDHLILCLAGWTDYPYPESIWAATQAVRQRSRVVEFQSGAQILEEFGLPHNGVSYRRLTEGFQRIFGGTIYFGTGDDSGRPEVFDGARFSYGQRIHAA